MSEMSNVDAKQEAKIERLEKDVEGVKGKLDKHERECYERHQSIQTRFTKIEGDINNRFTETKSTIKGLYWICGPMFLLIAGGAVKLFFFT